MLKLYSCQIGEIARRLLTPGACGQVLAGFSRAAYLVTEQAELFWLASENAPMHLRGMRIAGPFPKLAGGEKFVIEGKCIKIAPDLQVDFGDASPWAAPTIPAETAQDHPVNFFLFQLLNHFFLVVVRLFVQKVDSVQRGFPL